MDEHFIIHFNTFKLYKNVMCLQPWTGHRTGTSFCHRTVSSPTKASKPVTNRTGFRCFFFYVLIFMQNIETYKIKDCIIRVNVLSICSKGMKIVNNVLKFQNFRKRRRCSGDSRLYQEFRCGKVYFP